VAVSANIFASALWDLLTAGSGSLAGWAIAAVLGVSAAAFFGAILWLYLERHSILDARFDIEPRVEPRPVLITGLSDLNEAQLDRARELIDCVRRERYSIGVLAASPAAVVEKFGNETARLPWFQNV
jgi:hypothetical protein